MLLLLNRFSHRAHTMANIIPANIASKSAPQSAFVCEPLVWYYVLARCLVSRASNPFFGISDFRYAQPHRLAGILYSGFGKIRHCTHQGVNNLGADKTAARLCRFVCTFVVRMQQCQSFSRPCPFTRDCESEKHVSVCFLFLHILVGGDGLGFSLNGSMLCQGWVDIDTAQHRHDLAV